MPINEQLLREKGLNQQEIDRIKVLKGESTQSPTKEGKSASALDRLILSFGTGQGRDQYLQQKGIAPENVNKPGFDLGDVTSKAGGLLRDAGGSVGGAIGIGAGAAAGAGAGLVGAVPGAIAGGAILGGAGQTAGEGLRQVIGKALGVAPEPNSSEISNQGMTGAVFGALQPVLNKGASGILSRFVEQPGRRMKDALKPSLGEAQSYAKEIAAAAKQGYVGTSKNIQQQAEKVLSKTKPIVDKALGAIAETGIGVEDALVNELSVLEKAAYNAVDKGEVKVVESFFSELAGTIAQKTGNTGKMTVGQVNEMLRAMDDNIGKAWAKAAKVGAEITPDTEIRMKVAGVFRNIVNASLDDAGRKAMEQRHIATVVRQLAIQGMDKKNITSTLSKITLGGIGAFTGALIGKSTGNFYQGAGIGAGLGSAAALMAATPLAQSIRGQLGRPGAFAAKQVLEKIPEKARGVLVNLISQGLGN